MRAGQIMTPQVITTSPDASIYEAANTMLRHHIGGLPVVNADKELIGIVSEGDFIRRTEIGTQRKRRRWLDLLIGSSRTAVDFIHEQGRKVGDIMTPQPRTISEETPLDEIAQIMGCQNLKRLPVVRGARLVGMVTRADLVQAVANLAPDMSNPTLNDDCIRRNVIAAIANTDWAPCRLNVIVRDGNVTLSGAVSNQHARKASIIAAENISGVKKVRDCLYLAPPPEEDLGGGDIASLQEQPSTTDDRPL